MENIRTVDSVITQEEARLIETLNAGLREHGIFFDFDSLQADGYIMRPVLDDPDAAASGMSFVPYREEDDKHRIINDILDPNAFVFIYDSDLRAHHIEANKDRTGFIISEPLEQELTKPESPSWVTRLLAVFFSSFKRDVDKYEAQKTVYDAYIRTKTLDTISKQLDDVFKETEKAGKGDFSRLDYIMIGGRTLRGIITQEIIDDRPEGINGPSTVLVNTNQLDEITKFKSRATNDHIRDIICAAMAEGEQVEYVSVDPNGNILPSEDGNLYHVMKPVPEVEQMRLSERNKLFTGFRDKIDFHVDFNLFEDRRERWAARDACRKAVQLNTINFKNRSFDLYSQTMHQELFGTWLEKNGGKLPTESKGLGGISLSLSRSAFHVLTAAYLITDGGMSVDEFFSAADETASARKDAAAEHVINEITSGNGDLEKLISTGIRAQLKLTDYLNNNVNKILDQKGNAHFFGKEAAAVVGAASILFELNQECSRSDAAKQASIKVLAEVKNIEDPAKAEEAYDTFVRSMNDLSCLRLIGDGQKELINMATGCQIDSSSKRDYVSSEKIREHAAESLRQHKPASQVISVVDTYAVKFKTNDIIDGIDSPREFRAPRSFEDGSTFSQLVFSGKIKQMITEQSDPVNNRQQPNPVNGKHLVSDSPDNEKTVKI